MAQENIRGILIRCQFAWKSRSWESEDKKLEVWDGWSKIDLTAEEEETLCTVTGQTQQHTDSLMKVMSKD